MEEKKKGISPLAIVFIVIGVVLLLCAGLAILSSILLVAINPSEQLAVARDQQRRSDISALATAVSQYTAETKDTRLIETAAPCSEGATAIETDGELYDILVDTYLAALPSDPQQDVLSETGYVYCKSERGTIVFSAPLTELTDEQKEPISVEIALTK